MSETTDPNSPKESSPATSATALATDTVTLLPWAQLGLRLLGIYFFIEGVCGFIGNVLIAFILNWQYTLAGYESPVDAGSAGGGTISLLYTFVGFYLLLDGSWLLRNIFTPIDHEKHMIRRSSPEDLGK